MTTMILNSLASRNSRIPHFWAFTFAAIEKLMRAHRIDKARRNLRDQPDYILRDVGIERWEIELATANGTQDDIQNSRPFGYFYYL